MSVTPAHRVDDIGDARPTGRKARRQAAGPHLSPIPETGVLDSCEGSLHIMLGSTHLSSRHRRDARCPRDDPTPCRLRTSRAVLRHGVRRVRTFNIECRPLAVRVVIARSPISVSKTLIASLARPSGWPGDRRRAQLLVGKPNLPPNGTHERTLALNCGWLCRWGVRHPSVTTSDHLVRT